MPPRTKTSKSTKALKENIGMVSKIRNKHTNKVTNPSRKVLGDKTNSASDDNASLEIPYKPSKNLSADPKLPKLKNSNPVFRPRRDRRIPCRFEDNEVLKNLSKSKENVIITLQSKDKNIKGNHEVPGAVEITSDASDGALTSVKSDTKIQSPFKTPQKLAEISLVTNRPRRVSRLPSRFEDHSVSPSRFIPVQPCHASTPLAQKNPKSQDRDGSLDEVNKSSNSTKNIPVKVIITSNDLNEKTKVSSSDPKGRILRTRRVANGSEKSQLLKTRLDAKNADSNKKRSHVKAKSPVRILKAPVKTVKTPVKIVKSPTKVVKTPVKIVKSPTKLVKDPAKAVKTPVKRDRSAVKGAKNTVKEVVKAPVKPVKKLPNPLKDYSIKNNSINTQSPVKHSYLRNVNEDTSFGVQTVKSPVKLSRTAAKPALRSLKKDLSFKVLEENKKNGSNQDIYEFTFDPNEEPAPQKKKRKAVKKKPTKSKPKKVIYKMNYDQNVSSALAALKNVVGKKQAEIKDKNVQQTILVSDNVEKAQQPHPNTNIKTSDIEVRTVQKIPTVQRDIASKIVIGGTKQSSNGNVKSIQIQDDILIKVNKEKKQSEITRNLLKEPSQSIRVEDIAADFESSPQHDIDYSPVNTPSRPKTPEEQISRITDNMYHNDDPLNLKENLSFDINPIASSSMNSSVRHPHASPWRIEFENLPIRWHVSSYVKPNMTPAVECSFVNFDDKNKKKHVYTNLGPEEETPSVIVQKNEPNLVQTSIISFVKEVLEKSSQKKNRRKSATPVTASLFNDVSSTTPAKDYEKLKKSTRQLFTPIKNSDSATSNIDGSNTDNSNNVSGDKENSEKGKKRKNNKDPNSSPAKTPRKEIEDKYFGFDDSENQENVSPQKAVGRKKSLRQVRARAVLKEINNPTGPTRAALPIAVKTAKMAEVERLYDEMKSASDAPAVPSNEVIVSAAENVIDPIEELCEDSETSVPLFEDIDVVHHLKPHRKSYGKAKKVTFIEQTSTDTEGHCPGRGHYLRPLNNSDDEGDLDDLTFDPGVPFGDKDKKRTKKKQSKQQKMNKKEEEEAEAWAAGFNSMCEDVDEFTLIVE